MRGPWRIAEAASNPLSPNGRARKVSRGPARLRWAGLAPEQHECPDGGADDDDESGREKSHAESRHRTPYQQKSPIEPQHALLGLVAPSGTGLFQIDRVHSAAAIPIFCGAEGMPACAADAPKAPLSLGRQTGRHAAHENRPTPL